MILTNPFRPDERVRKEADVLARAGFFVTVLAWDREGTFPTVEKVSGFSVQRIRLKSRYFNFAVVLATLPIFWAAVLSRILTRDIDVIHCHDFDTIPVGFLVKILRRKAKVVYDAHEDYSSMVSKYVPSSIRTIIEMVDRLVSRKVDAVLTVSEALARKIPNANVYIVWNAPEDIKNEAAATNGTTTEWPPGFRILFVGFLDNGRGIETILSIASENRSLSLVLAGTGPCTGIVKRAASKFFNVRFLGYVSQTRNRQLLAECDLVYALSDPRIESYRVAAPNKLYEAMMSGKPALVSEGSCAEEIVRREQCGISADYSDPSSILQAILSLERDSSFAHRLGANGRRAFEEKYAWQFSAKSLIACYDSI
jgi:glycosyltransferase involved in cell wall biosynthesis